MKKRTKVFVVILIIIGFILLFHEKIIELYINSSSNITYLNKEIIEENKQKKSQIDRDSVSSISSLDLLKTRLSNINPNYIGVVSVPSINVLEPVSNDLTFDSLTLGAAVNYDNMIMGEGNYVLAGHLSYLGDGYLFSGIYYHVDENITDIPIYLTDYEYVYIYQSDTYQRVNSSDVDYIQQDYRENEDIITLYTCNYSPEYGRVILQGTLVNKIQVSDFGEDEFNEIFSKE